MTELTKLSTEQIKIFTDGAYLGNIKKAGYGVYFPNKEYKNYSRPFLHEPITNQRAELYAIYKALLITKDTTKQIIIYTDSEYSIKSLTIWIKKWIVNNWKTANNKQVLNVDLIMKIYNLMENRNIIFKHVRSHTNKKDWESLCNEEVDKLAKQGALLNDQLIRK